MGEQGLGLGSASSGVSAADNADATEQPVTINAGDAQRLRGAGQREVASFFEGATALLGRFCIAALCCSLLAAAA